jgi:hypothetical protein
VAARASLSWPAWCGSLSTPSAATSFWLIPTQTPGIAPAATGTVPIEFTYSFDPNLGDPSLLGPSTTGDNAAGSYTPTGGTVEPGVWAATVGEIGPFGPGGATPGFFNIDMLPPSRRSTRR